MQVSVIVRPWLLGAALVLGSAGTQAADFHYTGNLYYNTDRVFVTFEVGSTGDVRLWTDSWNTGQNFDPISAVWRKSGNDYTLVDENDDNSSIAAGQGSFDTGFSLAALTPGQYLYTVGASFLTPFVAGSLLSQGFTQDGTAPTPIALWDQPSYDINYLDQKGTLYSIRLSGVDAASVSAVPEPASLAMLLAGLGLLGTIVARRRHHGNT